MLLKHLHPVDFDFDFLTFDIYDHQEIDVVNNKFLNIYHTLLESLPAVYMTERSIC